MEDAPPVTGNGNPSEDAGRASEPHAVGGDASTPPILTEVNSVYNLMRRLFSEMPNSDGWCDNLQSIDQES